MDWLLIGMHAWIKVRVWLKRLHAYALGMHASSDVFLQACSLKGIDTHHRIYKSFMQDPKSNYAWEKCKYALFRNALREAWDS